MATIMLRIAPVTNSMMLILPVVANCRTENAPLFAVRFAGVVDAVVVVDFAISPVCCCRATVLLPSLTFIFPLLVS